MAANFDHRPCKAMRKRRAPAPFYWASILLVILSVGNFYRRHSSLFVASPGLHSFIPFSARLSNNTKVQSTYPSPGRRRLSDNNVNAQLQPPKKRVLYIATSMNEFDNGRRETTQGYNRFSETIVPLLRESTNSMIAIGYLVDVYFIAHYAVTDARRTELQAALPASVGLQIWGEATPIGYALEYSQTVVQQITRGLARQHRYVIKDKLLDYDMFVNFEDDMWIKGVQVEHFWNVTNELYRLRKDAPEETATSTEQARQAFHGELTKIQLQRMIPGFIRVEAALPGFRPGRQGRFPQVPINFQWNKGRSDRHIDPSICCHVAAVNDHRPQAPTQLYFWETSLDVLGIRNFPNRAAWDWVLLQAGNQEQFYPRPKFVIGDYWSGRDGYFDKRPNRDSGPYLNNQGGWMATRRQLLEWHSHWCVGGFLPPFDKPMFTYDGLDLRSVEYWSGGIQIVSAKACNLQRIVLMDPDDFSKHLLYHSSNNKQRTRAVKRRFSRTIDEFWGQLNMVRKNAEARMQLEMAGNG